MIIEKNGKFYYIPAKFFYCFVKQQVNAVQAVPAVITCKYWTFFACDKS